MNPGTKKTLVLVDLAGVGALMLLSATGYLLSVKPMLRMRELRTVQLQELIRHRELIAESQSNTAELTTEVRQLTHATAVQPLRLLSTQYSNQRLSELTELAAEYDLRIDQLRTGNSKPEGTKFELVPIQLVGGGSFDACTTFLNRLHVDFPDTGIASFDLADNPGDPNAIAAFKFDLMWYAAPSLTSVQ